MSRLRIRLVLNEGGEGTPFGKIVDVGREVERFLWYLAEDAGIGIVRPDWVARDFENASVRFDIEAPAIADIHAIEGFNRKLEYVASFDANTQTLGPAVRYKPYFNLPRPPTLLAPTKTLDNQACVT